MIDYKEKKELIIEFEFPIKKKFLFFEWVGKKRFHFKANIPEELRRRVPGNKTIYCNGYKGYDPKIKEDNITRFLEKNYDKIISFKVISIHHKVEIEYEPGYSDGDGGPNAFPESWNKSHQIKYEYTPVFKSNIIKTDTLFSDNTSFKKDYENLLKQGHSKKEALRIARLNLKIKNQPNRNERG